MSYHLTKSNPNIYKLRKALDYYNGMNDISWTICKNAGPGDFLFIGQSGEEAGIYAKAIVSGDTILEEFDDDFFIVPPSARKLAWMAPIEGLTPMKHPILESHLLVFPGLARVAKWLHRQGATLHLSDDEGSALLRFV